MKHLFMESGFVSLNKKGEELCGDRVEIQQMGVNGDFTMVLADGLGSGVKANILSTLTSKIIATMMASDMPLEDCVTTIAQTLPICAVRGVAYATFTIIKIIGNREACLIQYDNPEVIVLRDGKNMLYEMQERVIAGKKIYESRFPVQLGDLFIAMSDGVIHAGVGSSLNFGWERPNVVEFMEHSYRRDLTAKGAALLLSEACNELYMGEPGDDTTAAALRIREQQLVSLMIGPPVNPDDDELVLDLFFAADGKRVVCGGTTSAIVAKHLGTTVESQIDYTDPLIPPTGRIDGVDLCTEGVLTMGRVVELARQYEEDSLPADWETRQDGATRIARMLFDEATEIRLFVGRAMNPAHQNPDMPIGLSIKLRLIEDLAAYLKRMGKRVEVGYY